MSNTLDSEVVDLVNALNMFPGVETISSCCGHGNDVFNIWFIVDELDDLPEVLYYTDGCHIGVYGWSVEVSTDCAMSPVKFRLHSEAKGDKSYIEAIKIAEIMHKYWTEQEKHEEPER